MEQDVPISLVACIASLRLSSFLSSFFSYSFSFHIGIFMSQVVKFIPSQRGGKMAFVKDYIYTLQSKPGDEPQIWRCRDRNCRGGMSIVDGIVIPGKPHYHLPDESFKL